MNRWLYPGSFDPITNGHLNIIERTWKQCETLVIAIMVNPEKNHMFSVKERVEFVKKATQYFPNIEIISYTGLLADCIKEYNIDCVVRGIRNTLDCENELTMATVIKEETGVETIFIPTLPSYRHVSSSLARQYMTLRSRSVFKIVPESVAEWLWEKVYEVGK